MNSFFKNLSTRHEIVDRLLQTLRETGYSQLTRPLSLRIGRGGLPGADIAGAALAASLADHALTPVFAHSFQATERTNADEPLKIRLACISTTNALTAKYFLGQPIEVSMVADSGELRTLSGVITKAQSVPDDGFGLQPWMIEASDAMSLMRSSKRSRIFLRKDVVQIAETVMGEWSKGIESFSFDFGKLYASQRVRPDAYPVREMTLQWNESDAAFLQRLLRKHGISWAVTSAPSDAPIGHVLHLFDDSGSLPQNDAGSLQYHMNGLALERDGITQWNPAGQITPGTTEGHSWRPATQYTRNFNVTNRIDLGEQGNKVAGAVLDSTVDPANWGADSAHYEEMGVRRAAYHEMQSALVHGASSSRLASVLSYVGVVDAPDSPPTREGESPDSDYVFLQVDHWGQGNFPKELHDWTRSLFQLHGWNFEMPLIGLYDEGRRYANTFVAAGRSTPVVPRFDPSIDWPVVPPMSAVVVCPPGEEVWPADDGSSVYVRFVGLRVEDHDHAEGAGTSGTPADSAAIRVAMPAANENGGMVQLPRNGDEVLVTFISGDPDKPLITHAIHSETKAAPAFHNQRLIPGNRYLSGNRTTEIFGQRASHVLHDNTPGEPSLQMHHDHGFSQLSLGYLTGPRVEGAATPRGEGFELRTDAWGSLRAASGMLLSVDGRDSGAGGALSRDELVRTLEQALVLARNLGDMASLNKASQSDHAPQETLRKAVQDLGLGSNAEQGEGNQPILAMSAPAGIAIGTPRGATIASGQHVDIVAQQNQHLSAGEQMNLHAGQGISQFAQNGDIRSVAAKGKHVTLALGDDIQIVADKSVHIESSTERIEISAKDYILLSCGGAYIRIAGGNIELHSPGTIDGKAGNYKLAGPVDAWPVLDTSKPTYAAQYKIVQDGQPKAGQPYVMTIPDGSKMYGETGTNGKTMKVGSMSPKDLALTLVDKSDWFQENINIAHHDDLPWD